MPSVAFSLELGAGLGHILPLTHCAEDLEKTGWDIWWLIQDLRAGELLPERWRRRILPSPCARMGCKPPWPAQSYADILLGHGYADPSYLKGMIQAWQNVFALTQAQLVIADYAPTAVLAANLAQIPCYQFGNGFTLPPCSSEYGFPGFRLWQRMDEQKTILANHQLRLSLEQIVKSHSWTMSPYDLLQGNAGAWCMSWPELDHYAELRNTLGAKFKFYSPNVLAEPLLPLASTSPPPITEDGTTCFVYLKLEHQQTVPLLEAMKRQRDLQVVFYSPDVALVEKLKANRHWQCSSQPWDLSLVLPRCHAVISHAGINLTHQALSHGLPILALPSQTEQMLTGLRLVSLGVGHCPMGVRPDWGQLLPRFFSDATLHTRAQSLSKAHQAKLAQAPPWRALGTA